MTKSELRQKSLAKGALFFTRKSMRVTGDTMLNYAIKENWIDTWYEKHVHVWELYRKNPVKHNIQTSAYFRQSDLSQIHIYSNLTNALLNTMV